MQDWASDLLLQTQCFCAAARRTARAVTQLYDLVLAPIGLKATQLTTLLAIAEAGEIAQWQLAQGHAIAPETLSRRLSAALKKGYLEVRRSERGERLYRLSKLGQECLREALPYWERAQDRLVQALGGATVEEIITLFDRVTLSARAAEDMRIPNSAAESRKTATAAGRPSAA